MFRQVLYHGSDSGKVPLCFLNRKEKKNTVVCVHHRLPFLPLLWSPIECVGQQRLWFSASTRDHAIDNTFDCCRFLSSMRWVERGGESTDCLPSFIPNETYRELNCGLFTLLSIHLWSSKR
ncbi:unnamed protein product [Musa acuminata var. zebrina]